MNECELCGSKESLQKHHKDVNHHNNSLVNIQTLCLP